VTTTADRRPATTPPPPDAAPAPVIPPRTIFAAGALLCALGTLLVHGLARSPGPARLAGWSLVVTCGACLALVPIYRSGARRGRRALQTVLVVAAALLCAGPTWFFGPHSSLGGLVALLLLLAGVLSGGPAGRSSGRAGWLVYGALAGSQAAVTGLVLAGTLPDQSLTRVVIEVHPTWHHVLSQLSLQLVYLAAFLAGRSFQRRYAELAGQVTEALRVAARRGALLDEARAEYRRALAVGRFGVSAARHDAPRTAGEPPAAEPTDAGAAPPPDDAADLATLLRRRGAPLPAHELRPLIDALGRALDALHAAGRLHLDVHPGNLVRTAGPDGRPAWTLAEPGSTQLALARGSPEQVAGVLRFLAPERLGGAYADARADVYGMAATLYAALDGREPFAGLGPEALPAAVLGRMPEAPEDRGAVPAAVATVLRVGLARSPEHRPATAGELARALHAALDGTLQPECAARAAWVPPWGDRPSPAPPSGASDALQPARSPAPPAVTEPPPAPGPGRPSSPPAPEPSPAPGAAPAAEPASTHAWRQAYGEKMRGFFAGAVALCVGGALILGFIGRERGPLWFAWACMAGVLGAAWLHRRLVARGPGDSVYWPWALAGALSVGPAHSFGLHSAFASVLVLAVFSGGLFRATQRASWVDRRGLVLAAILASHTLLFVLILVGVVPDDGNVAVLQPGAPAWEAVVRHLLLLGIYGAAFAAGNAVDRAHQLLTARARDATLEATRRETLLTMARAELDRALAGGEGGVFTGLRVGPWEVGRLLGRGGMGEVYEARQAGSGVRAALKVIRGDRVGDPVFLRLFEQETAALRRIASPYVARVLDVGGLDDELPFLAMEFIEGRSLAALLRERDRLPSEELRALVRDVGRGLEDAHGAGVVHGDLKPQNVIRTADGGEPRWKLVDFGGARFVDAAGGGSPPLIVGTAAYMSPEQAAGDPVDARSDLYSWCLVLYRAAAGRPAFTAADPAEVARRPADVGPPDPRSCAELPETLALALRLGLAARPADRFADARELNAAFVEALDGRLDERFRRRARELLQREPWGSAARSAPDPVTPPA
jgi:serine/threonine-protein kinase